jgi:hypothetical protein
MNQMAKRKDRGETFEIMADIIELFDEHGCSPADAMLVCIQMLCVIAARVGRDWRDLPEAVDEIVIRLEESASWRELLTGMGESMRSN